MFSTHFKYLAEEKAQEVYIHYKKSFNTLQGKVLSWTAKGILELKYTYDWKQMLLMFIFVVLNNHDHVFVHWFVF